MSDDFDIGGKTAEDLLELYFSSVDFNNDDFSQEEMDKSMSYLKAAADKGSPEAWAELGACYFMGYGIKQDEILAHDYLEKAALKNVANAQMNLYCLMRDKAQTDEEKKNSLYWLNQAVENKVPSALYETGSLYYHGIVYEQDFKKAAKYMQLSAEANCPEAMATLGVMYQQGQGVDKDMSKAIEYFAKAADEGSYSGLCNLANAYMGGLGVEQDYSEAMACFAALVDLDEPFYSPDLNDPDVRADIALVFHQTNVYEMTYPMAHHNLGIMFQQGLGTDVDQSAALYHFMLASENGYAPSCLQAGSMLYAGEGIDRAEPEKAFEYLSVALDAGIPEAKLILGIMYFCGEGVKEDKEKGIAFLDELIAMGNVTAIKAKNDLLNN